MNYIQYLQQGNKLTRQLIMSQQLWLSDNGFLDLKGKRPDGYDTRKDGSVSDTEKARLAAQAAGWKFNKNGMAYKPLINFDVEPQTTQGAPVMYPYQKFMTNASNPVSTVALDINNPIKQELRALNEWLHSNKVNGKLQHAELVVDGKAGQNTNAVRDLAKNAGYTYQNGKYIKTRSETPTVTPLTREEASKLYQNGDGFINSAIAGIYHIVMPEGLPMPHSKKVKDLGAAIVGYYEGLPKKERQTYESGKPKIGYKEIGTLSGQSSNPNEQTSDNNAYGKVMGGVSPRNNGDGTYLLVDSYSFGVERDFDKRKSDGTFVATSADYTSDPSTFRAIKGLISDVKKEGFRQELKSDFKNALMLLGENFGARQGKRRDNTITYTIDEINKRNQN